jgi:hypothetical protein
MHFIFVIFLLLRGNILFVDFFLTTGDMISHCRCLALFLSHYFYYMKQTVNMPSHEYQNK